MYRLLKYTIGLFVIIIILNVQNKSLGEESEIYDILNIIQKDLKTLEKAVYSGDSFSISQSSDSNLSQDTLTRHLLKLSDIEQQFQELTNKFESLGKAEADGALIATLYCPPLPTPSVLL